MRSISKPKVMVGLVIMMNILLGICFQKEGYATNRDIKVSIIVPVYNVEKYIAICMDSLVNQTLKDIEIICVDDGSTDKSGKILDEYAKEDRRVIVIHQDHKGVSAARNRGLNYGPKGEYTTFVDSDDYIEIDTLRYLYNVAKVNYTDMVEYGWRRFGGAWKYSIWKKIASSSWENKKVLIREKKDFRDILQGNFFVCNKLYKTEILKQSKVRFIEGMLYEDNAYNLMILPYIRRYERVDKIFYNYRKTPGSITEKKNVDTSNCIKAILAVCNKWRECNILKENENYLLDVLIRKYYYLIEDTAKKDANYANEIAKSFGKDIYNANILTRCNKYTRDCVEKLESYRKDTNAVRQR